MSSSTSLHLFFTLRWRPHPVVVLLWHEFKWRPGARFQDIHISRWMSSEQQNNVIKAASHGGHGVSIFRKSIVCLTTFFMPTPEKTPLLPIPDPLREYTLTIAGGFPTWRAPNAESVLMSWHQHVIPKHAYPQELGKETHVWSRSLCFAYRWPNALTGTRLTNMDWHGSVIACIGKCGMKLLIQYQTSTVAMLKFGNG